MRQHKVTLFLIFELVVASHAQANNSQPNSQILLSTAIHQIWDSAPQLRALETQVSLAEKDKVRRFLPSEPQVSYVKDDSDKSQTYGVQLGLGFPGKAFAYSGLDSAQLRKQKLEQAAKKYELASLVTLAYVDCAVAQAIIQIREATISELEAFLQSLKSRRGVTQMEKISFELETRQTRQELLAARDTRDVRCQKFQTLMADSNSESPTLVLPDDLDESLIRELGSQTADENRASAAVGLAEANYSLASWSQLPDFTLSYSQKRMPDATTPTAESWSPAYGISVTLPLMFSLYERSEVQRAKSQALIDKSDAKLQQIQSTSDRIEAAKNFVRSQNYLKELRKKDLPLGQALLESAYSAYRGGQIGYADMVTSRKTLIDLRLKDVELRSLAIAARIKCLDQCDVGELKKDTNR